MENGCDEEGCQSNSREAFLVAPIKYLARGQSAFDMLHFVCCQRVALLLTTANYQRSPHLFKHLHVHQTQVIVIEKALGLKAEGVQV